MARSVRVFVACGSGIATSSIACDTVSELCQKAGIDVDISKGPLSEIPTKETQVDMILTTAKYRGECAVPLMCITSFITGIGQQATGEKLVETLRGIAAKI